MKINEYLCKKNFKNKSNNLQSLQRFKNIQSFKKIWIKVKNKRQKKRDCQICGLYSLKHLGLTAATKVNTTQVFSKNSHYQTRKEDHE